MESVVVATHCMAPFTCASICPLVPIPKKVEVETAVTFPVAPVLLPRIVFAAIVASLVNDTPLFARSMVEFAPPTKFPIVPVVVNVAEGVNDEVATDAKVVKPDTFEMYASCEMAMSEVVATAFNPVVDIVTAPVAPETEMPLPPTFDVTPLFVMVSAVPPTNAPGVPVNEMPVPLVTDEVATLERPFVPLPYKSCAAVKVVCPVPPLATPSEPVVSESAIFRVDVATHAGRPVV